MMKIKDLVNTDNKVRFLYYRKNELWYEVIKDVVEQVGDEYHWRNEIVQKSLFRFPVPISDCGDGTFLAEDRAITFMRYIRQQLEAIKQESQTV